MLSKFKTVPWQLQSVDFQVHNQNVKLRVKKRKKKERLTRGSHVFSLVPLLQDRALAR